jgi:hypothetical protein
MFSRSNAIAIAAIFVGTVCLAGHFLGVAVAHQVSAFLVRAGF